MIAEPKWFVSQIGRREGYVIPAALHSIGALASFHTDAWATNFPERLVGTVARSLKKRWRANLSDAPVTSCFTRFTLAKIACIKSVAPSTFWSVGGSVFSQSATATFKKIGISNRSVCLGYTAGNLEVIQMANQLGAKSLHVQIDPGLEWYRLRDSLRALHPGAEEASPQLDAAFVSRITKEWHDAQIVICHSSHTSQSLIKVGVAADKLRVIQPGFLPNLAKNSRVYPAGRRPRALFLGNVCLMKGFHDYCELARRLRGEIEFHCAGSMHMSGSFLQKHANDIVIHGHLQPQQVMSLLESVDVLIFPSHSEGFGLVQLEAMAAAVPVLSSTACGDVVNEGKNGYRYSPGDVDKAEQHLRFIFSNSTIYEKLSVGALYTAQQCTLDKQINELVSLVN